MKNLVFAVMLLSGTASAEFYDGAKLLKMMQGNSSEQVLAMGYIMGVFDAHQNATHCAPDGVQNTDLLRAMRKYLEASAPRQLQVTADVLISDVLATLWPCDKPNSRL